MTRLTATSIWRILAIRTIDYNPYMGVLLPLFIHGQLTHVRSVDLKPKVSIIAVQNADRTRFWLPTGTPYRPSGEHGLTVPGPSAFVRVVSDAVDPPSLIVHRPNSGEYVPVPILLLGTRFSALEGLPATKDWIAVVPIGSVRPSTELSLQIGVALGSWEKHSSFRVVGGRIMGKPGRTLQRFKQNEKGSVDTIMIEMALPEPSNKVAMRLVAFDRSGKMLPSRGGMRLEHRIEQFAFGGLVGQLGRIEIQSRPLEWITLPKIQLQ